MARVSRIFASAFALAVTLSSTQVFAQECSGSKCGGNEPIRDLRDDRANNQRDPIITDAPVAADFVLVVPPSFQFPASNSPVTRGSGGQIRSSWAVGVFR